MARRNVPHRPPGPREVPEGVLLRGRREKAPPRAEQQRAPREPEDHVIAHHARRYEEAYALQRAAEASWANSGQFGEPVFGVSGWIVAAPAEPFPEGFARLSTFASFGFEVVATPHLGRRGHVTILLQDPVDEDQAQRFNEAFGRQA